MRADLEKAYNEHVDRYGRASAVETVEGVAGTMFVTRVPDDKIDDVIAALSRPPIIRIGGRSKTRLARGHSFKSVREKLNAIAHTVYSRRTRG